MRFEHLVLGNGFYLDFTFMPASLREIISQLQAQPRFRAAAKSLVEADCHFGGNPAPAVNKVVEGLSGNAEDFSRFGDRQIEGFNAIVAHRKARGGEGSS